MADTFTNDLRLRLQESGANSGQWGTLLNTTISNIASAFSLGSEAIPDASTHTITLADGTADEARSMYLKCTGGGQACTVTLAPNTISKVWIISNETSFTLTFTQGSGANVAVAAGAVKMIVTDGAGSGAAVTDALSGLEGSLSTLALTGALTGTSATFTTTDNSDNLTLTSTDADASFGPNIRMYRNSGSPADNDLLGNIEFEGRNDNSQDVVYGRLFSRISDASDGSEDGIMRLDIMKAGSLSDVLTINSDEIIVNDGSYDYDFRVESNDNTHALFVEGSSGNVGIGTSSPTDFGSGFTTLQVTSANTTSGGVFRSTNSDSSIITQINSNSTGGSVGTATSHPMVFSTANTERMRISSAGAVGIGTTDMQGQLNVGVVPSGDSAMYIFGSRGSADNLAAGNLTFRNVSNGTGDVNLTRIQTLTGTGSSQSQKGQLTFSTNAGSSLVERMRISSDGAVILKPGGITTGLRLQGRSSDNNFFIQFNSNDGNTNYASVGVVSSDSFLQFSSDKHKFTNQATNSEYMRIDSSGNLLVGCTALPSGGAGGAGFETGQSSGRTILQLGTTTTSAEAVARFYNPNGAIGNITLTGSTCQFNSPSDYRLKENIADADDAGSKVDAIQVRKFDWKADGSHQDYGMIAQELQTVAPEAVSAPKDPDEMMGVDYSKLVPMLVKEIQSLRARVNALEAE